MSSSWQRLWNFTKPFLVVSFCLGIMMLGFTCPAQARLQEIEEAPEQMVYQSRQAVRDQQNQTWQIIAYQRVKAGQISDPYLRVVGFPGIVRIDAELPLIMSNALGDRFAAPPAFDNLFTDTTHPESHIAQYDLADVIPRLNIAVPLRLEIPSPEKAVINISPSALFEWQNLSRTSQGKTQE